MTDTAERQQHPLDNWPSKDYDGPQPWDHDALGVSREDRDKVGSKRNTLTPTITHPYPILTSGSAHPVVHELGRKLGDLGFPNSVANGENPFGTVDQTVLTAVQAFRRQFGVRVDPSSFNNDERLADAHIDPWTTEGILRAHKRQEEDQ
jgi:hypothetical protein